MATLDEVFESYKKLSYEDLVLVGKKEAYTVMKGLERDYPNSADKVLIVGISIFISEDNLIDDSEYQLFKDITGAKINRKRFNDIMLGDGNTAERVKILKAHYKQVDSKEREAFIRLGLCFTAVDGEITREEKNVIKQFLKK